MPAHMFMALFFVVVVVFLTLYGTRHVSRLRQINQIVSKFLK